MARESSYELLSGLLSNGVDLIDEVQRSVTEEHFTDPTLRTIYRLLLSYRSIAQGVLTRDGLDQYLQSSEAGTAAQTREMFDTLIDSSVSPDMTRLHMRQVRAARERSLTTRAMNEASDILTGSVTEEADRYGRPGRTWSGPADAREWLAARIAEINTENDISEAPAADVLTEGRQVLLDYQRARDEDRSRRPRTGIDGLDALSGGIGKGELVMIAAPSGYGKTQLCVSMAYHASQMQGLHVYFATSETVRTTVRSRLIARHSMHEKFEDMRNALQLPRGLDSKKITRGQLDPDHEPFLLAVARDYGATGEASSPGSCWVSQMPHGQTIPGLRAQIEQRARTAHPDLVIVDYLALMSATDRFQSSRESLSSVVKGAAHFAVDFAKGDGVPVVSPWQLNRESQREMVRTGEIDQNGLAETAEAVNSADQVWVLTPDGERDGREGNLKLNVVKSREGEVRLGDNGFPLKIDYATSLFEDRSAATTLGSSAFNPIGDLAEGEASSLLGSAFT